MIFAGTLKTFFLLLKLHQEVLFKIKKKKTETAKKMVQLKFLIGLLFFAVAQGGQLRFHKADDLQLADFHLFTKQRIKEAGTL